MADAWGYDACYAAHCPRLAKQAVILSHLAVHNEVAAARGGSGSRARGARRLSVLGGAEGGAEGDAEGADEGGVVAMGGWAGGEQDELVERRLEQLNMAEGMAQVRPAPLKLSSL